LELGLITLAVTVASILIPWLPIRKGMPRLGVFAGLFVIGVTWAISEGIVIGQCFACGDDPLSCEWTSAGVLTFAVAGIGAALAYLAVVLGALMPRGG
jgi:hypothetical protein